MQTYVLLDISTEGHAVMFLGETKSGLFYSKVEFSTFSTFLYRLNKQAIIC